ncbi:hypothetical protein [Limosilactobacillus agrestis]|nr:hypothetical protein [Limosilactobacillus agrestis]MCD7113238.1 hypothetical protein [Limosilactobacillus agrestis]MCD7120235.1 hypothetical protein [Limosilactobacillus agrestis]
MKNNFRVMPKVQQKKDVMALSIQELKWVIIIAKIASVNAVVLSLFI